MRRLKGRKAKWDREPPASEEAVKELVEQSGLDLPEDYLSFLKFSNGGEGHINIQPGWFRIWHAEEVIETNEDYELNEDLPGFFGFGSSGGGEMLAFDMRDTKPWPVVMIPFGALEEEFAIKIAVDFLAFADAIGREMKDEEWDAAGADVENENAWSN
jgi:hypothetical protein